MSELHEKKISSEMIYQGRILNLRVDTVKLPNGNESKREVVEYAGAVAVVALDDNNEVFLVRQYRYPVDQELLEIPAGKIEKGEDPMDCAKRELVEETGCRARKWQPLYSFFSTPGFTSEKLHLFLATELQYGEQKLDDDEFLRVHKIPLEKALDMVARGEICDAKSIVGLLGAHRMLFEK